jgi:molybdate transport system ATP-binding protein
MENNSITIDIEKAMHTVNGLIKLKIQTEINQGELATFFGASGSGKTTLLRIIAGLTQPEKGSISFGNKLWFHSNKKINLPPQQRNIGFVFQDYALFPNMTVEENITFAQNKPDTQFTESLLETFELTELCKRKAPQLSGGQKQRVALARALARKPSILLLDEPLSALDTNLRILLQDEIAKVHSLFNATTLLVSHDLAEVFRLASKVYCLENGTIVQSGAPEDVFMDRHISGKFQLTGQIVRIEKQDVVDILTIVTGNNQIVKVVSAGEPGSLLQLGDRVLVFSKAFNPIITKIEQ